MSLVLHNGDGDDDCDDCDCDDRDYDEAVSSHEINHSPLGDCKTLAKRTVVC